MKFSFNNAPSFTFNNPEYIRYVVEYQGDIVSEANLGFAKGFYITVINEKYAVVTKKSGNVADPSGAFEDRLTLENSPFPSVVYVGKYYMYSLSEVESKPDKESISPIVAAKINMITSINSLNVTGKGVIVGIVDTGIDYLNKEFIKEDGTSRIALLWDQTLEASQGDGSIPLGVQYNREDINAAIKAYSEGRNPYDIVKTKDDEGHGTAVAGVIGARGVNEELRGAAPECDFIVVKLSRSTIAEKTLDSSVPIYDMATIMLGIEYVFRYALEFNIPTVIYMSLGTTLGSHRVNGILESYIDDVCNNLGVAVVTSTGNEGDAGNHASGNVNNTGQFIDTDLYIGKGQKFLRLEVWIEKPNLMSIDIISPAGEVTGIVPVILKQKEITKFTLEETSVLVQYYYPEKLSGDELIYVDFFNLQPGPWKIRLHGDYILDGRFDMWIPPRGVLKEETKFSSPNSYGTITNPSTSRYSVTIGNYDQTNLNIVRSSGVCFCQIEFNQIDVVAGGINVKCIYPDNKIVVLSGGGISAAVAAGALADMFQWGIINKNDVHMYAQTLKSYIQKGTQKRKNDIYPNAQWGHGILDLLGVFSNL